MENQRKENNKTELFVISLLLIGTEMPQGFGKRILKPSLDPKSRLHYTSKCVFVTSCHLPSH